METSDPIISVDSIVTRFGTKTIHNGVSFTIGRGQVVALIGMSGTGKSVLIKEIVGLLRPTAGKVALFGQDVWSASEAELLKVRNRFGMLFQNGALFSSLTAGENVAVPLVEQTDIPDEWIKRIVELRVLLTGLSRDTCFKMPNELSGGMRKRIALARALALEPELLFLDEPTSGLDPVNAREFDKLVRTLCDNLGLTTLLVTHDLDTLAGIVDRVIVLGEGKVIADGPVAEVSKMDHPWIRTYFSSRVN